MALHLLAQCLLVEILADLATRNACPVLPFGFFGSFDRDNRETVGNPGWAKVKADGDLLQVSTMISGGARESRDNVVGLSAGVDKGIMG